MQVLVVGLGNIGLGLTVPVFQAAGYRVFGTDVSRERLNQLAKPYRVKTSLASSEYRIETVPFGVFPRVDLAVISVGRLNIGAVMEALGKGGLLCPVALAENLPNPILIERHIPMVVDRICPRTEWSERSGLTVYAEDNFKIVVLDTPLTQLLKSVKGVELLPTAELVERVRKQKMFTVNAAHIVTAIVGGKKGYRLIEEAAKDGEIQEYIMQVISEVSVWLDLPNMAGIAEKIIKRFQSPLGDTIERVLGPADKRGKNDYLLIPLREIGENRAPTLKKILEFSRN